MFKSKNVFNQQTSPLNKPCIHLNPTFILVRWVSLASYLLYSVFVLCVCSAATGGAQKSRLQALEGMLSPYTSIWFENLL
jgi:hypothetical protein